MTDIRLIEKDTILPKLYPYDWCDGDVKADILDKHIWWFRD